MFVSNLIEAKTYFNDYLLKSHSYCINKRNLKNTYKKLILDSTSINFIYLNRNYDKEAWQFSKEGFFNFKNLIPELIIKL